MAARHLGTQLIQDGPVVVPSAASERLKVRTLIFIRAATSEHVRFAIRNSATLTRAAERASR